MRPAGVLAFLLMAVPALVHTQPRIVRNLDIGWKFIRQDIAGAEANSCDTHNWEAVSLPHTWNALDGQDGGNDYYRGVGWYRRAIPLLKADRYRTIVLKFNGASTVTTIFVNGRPAGVHRGGFGAFCVDITRLVRFNEGNVLAVKVDNAPDPDVPPLSGDFTVFGGLYRSVQMLLLNDLSISPFDDASPGVLVSQSRVSRGSARIGVSTFLRNASGTEKKALLRCSVIDKAGRTVAFDHTTAPVLPRSMRSVTDSITIPSPHLWNGRKDPYLYHIVVEVLDRGRTVDRVVQPVGFRFFRIDPEKGFTLNGEAYPLHGVNRHQDRENKGWAISMEDQREDYRLIEELGCTAVRLAHYQHAQEFYDLCDRGGMVVWAELALVDKVGPSPEFEASCKQQLSELIKQNFNHPSIFFWSLYNELIPVDDRPLYGRVVAHLNTLAGQLDPGRLTTAASRGDYDMSEFINTVTDVIGFNEYKGWYEGKPDDVVVYVDEMHRKFPGRLFCISEYGAGAGISQHEVSPSHPRPDGPWHPEEWQMKVHETAWRCFERRPFVWGTFVWNMFDFASDRRSEGEHPGRNDKGLVTYDRRVKKDAFFWYKAHWNSAPMVHVTGKRFSPRSAGPSEIKVYSNCDSVEVSLNGSSLGWQAGEDCSYVWQDVILPPGRNTITARGVSGGKSIVDACVISALGH